jgi:hypothetical protein
MTPWPGRNAAGPGHEATAARRVGYDRPMSTIAWLRAFAFGAAVLCAACTQGGTGAIDADDPAAPGDATSGCDGEGAVYDVTRSRFAFGSTPTSEEVGDTTRWTGTNGVLVINNANGHVSASMNGGLGAASPDWSDDPDALAAHVRDYFVSLGVAPCQIGGTQVLGGSHGRMIALARAIDGIRLPESMAHAKMNRDDHTTSEGFYWPTVPKDVVTRARAFRDRLATPAGLADYKAKLPENGQGDGAVVLHHRSAVVLPDRPKEFVAMPTWDVRLSDAHSSALSTSFDENGEVVDVALW